MKKETNKGFHYERLKKKGQIVMGGLIAQMKFLDAPNALKTHNCSFQIQFAKNVLKMVILYPFLGGLSCLFYLKQLIKQILVFLVALCSSRRFI